MQRLMARAAIEKVALAGGRQAFDAVPGIHLELVAAYHAARCADLPDGEGARRYIVVRAEMRANASALAAELLQVPLGVEFGQTADDSLRTGIRAWTVAVPEAARGHRLTFVDDDDTGKPAIAELACSVLNEGSEPSTERQVVQRPIPGQEYRAAVEKLIEKLHIGDAGMAGRHVHDLDGMPAEVPRELAQQRRVRPEAFVDDNTLDRAAWGL